MGKGKKSKSMDGSKIKKSKQQPAEPFVDRTVENVSVGIWPPADDAEDCTFVDEGLMLKLRLERVVLYEDVIFSVKHILAPAECKAWIQWGESAGFLEAKQQANAWFAHRDNGRIATHSPDVAQRIFERVRHVVPEEIVDNANGRRVAVGCSSNIRLYRYLPGQRFGKHIDESNFEEESQAWSEFTLLFYLNDNLEGGETVFYKGSTGAKEVLRVTPCAGAALLHWHGERCLLHEGAGVRSGTKYLLRTDVLYK